MPPLVRGRWSAATFTSKLAGSLAAAGLAGGKPVGPGVGLEDVGVEGDAVDDRGDNDKAGVGEDGSPGASAH